MTPTLHLDDLDVSRCVFAGDVVAQLGDEVSLYLRAGGELSLIGSYPTAGEALSALDFFEISPLR